jgi:DNA-binding beta-propeller fold protein YncE
VYFAAGADTASKILGQTLYTMKSASPPSSSTLAMPTRIAIDEQDNIYVADTKSDNTHSGSTRIEGRTRKAGARTVEGREPYSTAIGLDTHCTCVPSVRFVILPS